MSHNLEQNENGTETSFFSVRVSPWHTLGQLPSEVLTATEAMEQAHLDWTVEKRPIFFAADPNLEGLLPVEGKFATVRTNPYTNKEEALGVVGRGYTVVQNIENADFLQALVDASGAMFETGGSLEGGKRTFLTMKAPEGLMIGGRDAVDLYLAATNSHDGSSPFTIAATPTRIVCGNTLRMGLASAKATYKVRHTVNATKTIEQAQDALGLMWDYWGAFEATAENLLGTTLTDAEVRAFFDSATPIDPMAKTPLSEDRRQERIGVMQGIYHGETIADIKGNAWGAWNAFTEYADWYTPVRDGLTARAEKIILGEYDKTKQHALALLMG